MLGFGAIGEHAIGEVPFPAEVHQLPALHLISAVNFDAKTGEGRLIASTKTIWNEIVRVLGCDWSQAFKIPPDKWEEIVAGAFKKDGYDDVTLTPRSGDHGRDVIAVRKGVGSVRILGSVKAYAPGNLITKEQVHALMGVVGLDPNASKGIITTTSDFAPRLLEDPNLAAAVPHRIELVNGAGLQSWLKGIVERDQK
ncbi:restriction endonuclease [Afipia birgiae]|jgi:restriction system protein|uniref:restriction endonuclease n=1 Tax=Afipia birgiae TaxID=151414 RepID=UPI0009EB2171|nr:restriction endonuclease [Afipia birgiae]